MFAYLTPDGGWSLSNAGIVYADGEAAVIDTLTDRRLTREMLDQFKAVAPAGTRIKHVVNTHAHPDHSWGNGLFVGQDIVCSRSTLEEFDRADPIRHRRRLDEALAAGHEGALFYANYMRAGNVDRSDGTTVKPTRSFSGSIELSIGARSVQLIEVGPAHTPGDVIAYVPDARVLMTGDILFSSSHPLLGAGASADGWIAACDRIMAMDVEVIIPGHGPIATKDNVRATKDYFIYVREQARRRYDAGLGAEDAAAEIALDAFAGWGEPERVAANVAHLYEEFGANHRAIDPLETFAMMYRYQQRQR
jgi:glyoxylase-like metal-dependent hydrolase (beta-lactamase superfamily II)